MPAAGQQPSSMYAVQLLYVAVVQQCLLEALSNARLLHNVLLTTDRCSCILQQDSFFMLTALQRPMQVPTVCGHMVAAWHQLADAAT
jgi:hypothetical protein